MPREAKKEQIDENLMRKAKNIAEEFELFTDNYRTLLLVHRAKEGAVKAGAET